MKKILLVLAIIMGFSAGANAQVCMISGDKVEVLGAAVFGDRVDVAVGNHSPKKSARVTVIVEVTYETYVNNKRRTKSKEYSGKTNARYDATTVIEIPIKSSYPDSHYRPVSVEALSIEAY